MSLSNTILIASHDAGGAELLADWVSAQQSGSNQFLYCIDGPALKIFEQKKIDLKKVSLLEIKNFQIDQVITSTSWASDLEKTVLKFAKSKNIPSVSYLDHWMNYPKRFILNDESVLPDEIWVSDKWALEIAKKDFPRHPVTLKQNGYIENIIKEIKQLEINSSTPHLLYVTEPTSKARSVKEIGYDEYQAIEKYLNFLRQKSPIGYVLRVRTHPAEPKDKYQQILEKFKDLNIELSHNQPLAADLAWSTQVIGCESMVMAIAVFAGKPVYCSIPNSTPPRSLPFKEIIKLF